LGSYIIQQVLIPVGQGYETVDVQIEGETIAAIAPHLEPTGTVIDGQHKLLLPGFVNAHTHSSELWQRGAIAPLPLELWLAELCDFAPLNLEQVYLSALGTAVETLLSGGTTVVDHLTLIPGHEKETVAAAVRAYQEVGIQAFVGPLIQDQSLTTCLPSGGDVRTHAPHDMSAQDNLDLMAEVVASFHRPQSGIHIMLAPTGLQLCSDELFEGCVELSDRHTLCRHTHLLESKVQQIQAYEKYGCSAVEQLQRLGFLGASTSLAHCIWLDDADIAILADTHSTVVHNPLSNLRLGSGIAPILKYRQAGVNVTFGCDGSASNDSQDVLEAVKLGCILHNTTDFDYRHWITPREAIQMATLGGATGLNVADQIGSLAVGKQADLALYDLTSLSLLPRTDPIGLLVLGRPTQAVHSVWVKGRLVVKQGEMATIDLAELRRELFARSQWDGVGLPVQSADRTSALLQEMEAPYRRVMGLPE